MSRIRWMERNGRCFATMFPRSSRRFRAAATSGVNLEAGGQAQYVHQGRISAHYLDVLAVRPMLGRNFTETEDRPHGPPAAILSYAFWRTAFAANPDIGGARHPAERANRTR